jgi:acetoin:2,6-dichlorophenolindophenol oxidoreductase subunit beta
MREITYAQAMLEALQEEFRRDKRHIYLGTITPAPMVQEFGEERIRSTPISESGFAGAAIGLAGSGYRPVANMGMATFAFVAMDQFVNQAAKITYMFGGQAKFPIVYMMTVGAGGYMAAQHQISPYAMYMNVPGLKIALPATPHDAKGLLKTALRDNNPVIFFPNTVMSNLKGQVPGEEYIVPFGQADVARKGRDVTVVALSRMRIEALAAAEELGQRGVSLEVIDPRTLVPLDIKAIRDSVARTGRLVVVDEACSTCSAASEITARVVQDAQTFGKLKSAPKLVCGLNVPIPYSPPMEKYAVPDKNKIMDAVSEAMG